MIAVVGASVPPEAIGAEPQPSLPDPPAARWSGFLLVISRDLPLSGAIAWGLEIRRARPFIPIGLVGQFDASDRDVLDTLKRLGLPLRPVLNADSPPTSVVSPVAIGMIREQAIDSAVAQEWMSRWGVHDPGTVRLLHVLSAVGVRGGKVKQLPRHLSGEGMEHWSESTIRRRLSAAGLPSPRHLLRLARLRSVELRKEGGADLSVACRAAGFSSRRHWKRAVSRMADGKRGSA